MAEANYLEQKGQGDGAQVPPPSAHAPYTSGAGAQKARRESWSSNLGLHILMVAGISLLLLIPTIFFNLVLSDRQANEQRAITSMVTPWGGEQRLADPELIVEVEAVRSYSEDAEGSRVNTVSLSDYFVSPLESDTSVALDTHKRYRGNYETTLYRMAVHQLSTFALSERLAEIEALTEVRQIMPNGMKLIFHVSNNKGIDEIKYLCVNGKAYTPEPSGSYSGIMVHLNSLDVAKILHGTSLVGNDDSRSCSLLKEAAQEDLSKLQLHETAQGATAEYDAEYASGVMAVEALYYVRGAQGLSFIPIAQDSRFNVAGTGVVPSFGGAFLPTERTITGAGVLNSTPDDELSFDFGKLKDSVNPQTMAPEGTAPTFKAYYAQNNLATGQAQVRTHQEPYNLNSSEIEYQIELADTSETYQLIDRLTKYVLLFISMTFVTILAFEIVMRRMVSLVQYVVVGAALILFYMVLLALSEHTTFEIAYISGAVLMSLMIGAYLKAVLNSVRSAICVVVLLLAMYAVLFAIVHIQAYALLVGTVLLVIMLGIVMFITRRLNAPGHEVLGHR